MFARASRSFRPVLDSTGLSFLYCTKTILRDHAVRPLHVPSNGYIPFEGLREPATTAFDPVLEGTTITPSEKKALENLLRLRTASENSPKPQDVSNKDPDKTEDGASTSPSEALSHPNQPSPLDRLLDETITSARKNPRIQSSMPEPLRFMADEAAKERRLRQHRDAVVRERAEAASPARDSVARNLAARYMDHVSTELAAAPSDAAAWRVFEDLVVKRVAALGLDDGTFSSASSRKKGAANQPWVDHELTRPKTAAALPKTSPPRRPSTGGPGQHSNTSPSEPWPTNIQVMTRALPQLLKQSLLFFRTHYRSSGLALAVLPALKHLGPASFALGASGSLYTRHMELLWDAHPLNPELVTEILAEMEREVFPFNEWTLALLRRMLGEISAAREGRWGETRRRVWGSERMGAAARLVYYWSKLVEERREEQALRMVREIEGRERTWEGEKWEGEVEVGGEQVEVANGETIVHNGANEAEMDDEYEDEVGEEEEEMGRGLPDNADGDGEEFGEGEDTQLKQKKQVRPATLT